MIVIPERGHAGRQSERLGEAHDERLPKSQVAHRACLRRPIRPVQEQRAGGEEDENLPRLAEVVGDRVLTREPDDAGWNGGDEHEPRDPLVGPLDAAPTHRVEPGTHETDDVAPEVGADRHERPQVECDVEGLVEAVVLLEVRPVGAPGNEDEVPRGRDGQELRQTLDDPEDERLPVRQRGRVVPHSEDREHRRGGERDPRHAEDEGASHGRILRGDRRRKGGEEFGRKLRQSGERGA